MSDKDFLKDYFERYLKSLFETDVYQQMKELKSVMLSVKENNKKVIIAGNGGSASIASHVAVDFTKQAGIRTVNFNEPGLITCFANDYGYEQWLGKAIEFYGDAGDVAIFISSSGHSKNIVNAAQTTKDRGIKVVTFTGFNSDNPLKSLGFINFWLNSKAYNIVENTHQIWLLAVCDMLIGKAEYPA